jgi:hypothetical protein
LPRNLLIYKSDFAPESELKEKLNFYAGDNFARWVIPSSVSYIHLPILNIPTLWKSQASSLRFPRCACKQNRVALQQAGRPFHPSLRKHREGKGSRVLAQGIIPTSTETLGNEGVRVAPEMPLQT